MGAKERVPIGSILVVFQLVVLHNQAEVFKSAIHHTGIDF